MSQACYFTPAESKNNPLYLKMRERFSCGGNMTIGELMLRRADRAANKETPAAPVEAAPVARKEKVARPRMERRHATAISCVFLAFIAVTLIVLLLSSYTGLSITASPADADSVVSGESNVVSDAVPVNESSSFDNVLGAMYQSFGE